MANLSSSLSSYVFGLLTSGEGLNQVLQTMREDEASECPEDVRAISIQNTSPELVERSTEAQYPAVLTYCEKLTNSLKEKFQNFSGKARLLVEVRCSQDRLQGMERNLEQYADAVCLVLDGARGTWQDGAYYTGGYEVAYGPVKHGGRNFLQIAKISFEVEISR